MEVTGAVCVVFDAVNPSNLLLFTVEEATLAFHAENDWRDFVFASLIQEVSEHVVLCREHLIFLLEVFRF